MQLDALSIFMGVCALLFLVGCGMKIVRREMPLRDALLIAVPGVGTAILLIFAYEHRSGHLLGIAILVQLFLWSRVGKMVRRSLRIHREQLRNPLNP